MSEHFLLSRLARDLPVTKVIRMSQDEAYNWFRRARWPETKGKPSCPHCGVRECYVLTRRRFKCRGCRKELTVISGTILASRKLPFRQILAIFALSANGAKGKVALELCREIGVRYKTAWANLMKLREALAARRDDTVLEVEIDGLYALGHVRPKNRKKDRVDRRLPENQSPKRMVVMALRERRKGGKSASRITWSGNADCAWDIVRQHVAPSAHLFADEHAAYNELVGLNKLTRVNHQVASQHGEGISTRTRSRASLHACGGLTGASTIAFR